MSITNRVNRRLYRYMYLSTLNIGINLHDAYNQSDTLNIPNDDYNRSLGFNKYQTLPYAGTI